MFYYNYDPEIFFAIIFSLALVFLLLFFGIAMRAFYTGDKALKKGNEPNELVKLQYSKILFLLFYKRKEGISKEIFGAAIRNYIYCLVVILSIVAYGIFKTKVTFIISAILVVGEFLFVLIDALIYKSKKTKKQ